MLKKLKKKEKKTFILLFLFLLLQMNLNPNAAPFFPVAYEKEVKMMDEIEKNFLRQNRWLFDPEYEHSFIYKEYLSEKKFIKQYKNNKKIQNTLPRITE